MPTTVFLYSLTTSLFTSNNGLVVSPGAGTPATFNNNFFKLTQSPYYCIVLTIKEDCLDRAFYFPGPGKLPCFSPYCFIDVINKRIKDLSQEVILVDESTQVFLPYIGWVRKNN